MVENQDLYPYNRKSGGTCRNKTEKKGGRGYKTEQKLKPNCTVNCKSKPNVLPFFFFSFRILKTKILRRSSQSNNRSVVPELNNNSAITQLQQIEGRKNQQNNNSNNYIL
jgi:hypothetical protein